LHPNKELQLIEEENYFFRFSKYQEKLLELYEKRPDFVLPKTKQLEIKNFVRQGLNDFSISRLKSRLPWGIEVPGDSSQVIYVWFDALINYIATLGWPKNKEKFETFWPGFQVAGKDNLRQQAAMWQAMLFSAKLPPSQQIFIHGFISVAGQKMSKTLGNVVDPFSLVEKYGVDALRYYLLREIPPSEDGDFTIEKFQERYNADLAKGLGNLLARVFSMIQKYSQNKIPKPDHNPNHHPLKIDQELYNQQKVWQDLALALQNLKFNEALASLWRFLSEIDRYIDREKPWQLFKENKTKELNWVLFGLADAIYQLSWQLYPFLPRTSLKIAKILNIQGLLKEKPCLSDKEDFIKSGLSLDFSSLETFFPRLA
jgi:methionyl-tRNA synthetase